ncbi:MAG: PD40 domain-containing protein [Anaerolineae bacterium]|nr:PD40 domain-containing protein [Anaerolineae bacterium]
MTRFLIRLISRVSFGCIGIVLLALAVGRILPPEDEILFSASTTIFNIQIFRMSIARQIIVPMTSSEEVNASPVWSPDGQSIAFISKYQNGQNIYLMNPTGGGINQLTDSYGGLPIWSPDGQKIAFTRFTGEKNDVMLKVLQSDETHQLTHNTQPNFSPTWLPDSQHLTFISIDIHPHDETSNVNNLDIENGQTHLIFTTQHYITNLAWSPDARYLAYLAYAPVSALYLWDTIRNQSFLLYIYPFIDPEMNYTDVPEWSADGRSIFFATIYTPTPDTYRLGIFQLVVASCLQQAQNCSPKLLGSLPTAYYVPHFDMHLRPHQP